MSTTTATRPTATETPRPSVPLHVARAYVAHPETVALYRDRYCAAADAPHGILAAPRMTTAVTVVLAPGEYVVVVPLCDACAAALPAAP